jgi:hypothetical protein
MIPTWPQELLEQTSVEGVFLQNTLISGFRSGPRGARLSTAVEVGPPKMRSRGIKLRRIAFAEILTADQRARFDRFWEEELNNGVLPFLYPDPHMNGFSLCDDSGLILQDENGNDLLIEQWLLCQFGTNDPAWAALPGAHFAPQFDIVVLP